MPIRIRRPRNLSKAQLFVGLAIGVISGAYIYQPYFLKQKQVQQKEKLEESKVSTN